MTQNPTSDLSAVLAAWDLYDLPCYLHAERENKVYAVGTPQLYALRVHRPHLRTVSQIEAELTWMTNLADQALPVPRAVALRDNTYVLNQDGQLYSLITWLPGTPLGTGQSPLTLTDPEHTFHALGQLLARLHATPAPTSLDRPLWDWHGLLGEKPLWGEFLDHPDLDFEARQLLGTFRNKACRDFEALNLPYQLIHADPLQENVLVQGRSVALIDFDDCAYGYPLFDLATALVQRLPDPNLRVCATL